MKDIHLCCFEEKKNKKINFAASEPQNHLAVMESKCISRMKYINNGYVHESKNKDTCDSDRDLS